MWTSVNSQLVLGLLCVVAQSSYIYARVDLPSMRLSYIFYAQPCSGSWGSLFRAIMGKSLTWSGANRRVVQLQFTSRQLHSLVFNAVKCYKCPRPTTTSSSLLHAVAMGKQWLVNTLWNICWHTLMFLALIRMRISMRITLRVHRR